MKNIRVIAFEQKNTKGKPNEDCHYWVSFMDKNKAFAVADGVSRTPGNVPQLHVPLSSYTAAATFCHQVACALVTNQTMQEAFARANVAIAELNQAAGIGPENVDYLVHDYLGCVGVAGVITAESPNRLAYGHIGDCSILVYDANYFPMLLPYNSVGLLEYFREGRGFADENEEKVFWRKEMRNRVARFMTYGVLTGEALALSQLRTGYIDLEPNDTVILFSDGIYPFIFDIRFLKAVSSLLHASCDEGNAHTVLDDCISVVREDLQRRGSRNLDDDKTLIAFTMG